jgi:hypothetical protein
MARADLHEEAALWLRRHPLVVPLAETARRYSLCS